MKENKLNKRSFIVKDLKELVLVLLTLKKVFYYRY